MGGGARDGSGRKPISGRKDVQTWLSQEAFEQVERLRRGSGMSRSKFLRSMLELAVDDCAVPSADMSKPPGARSIKIIMPGKLHRKLREKTDDRRSVYDFIRACIALQIDRGGLAGDIFVVHRDVTCEFGAVCLATNDEDAAMGAVVKALKGPKGAFPRAAADPTEYTIQRWRGGQLSSVTKFDRRGTPKEQEQ